MKSSLRRARSTSNPLRAALALGIGLGLGIGILASPREAAANAELDRSYALESVAALRSSDNVDGLFADYVASAYKDYFAHQSRFIYQELGRADTLLEHSKLPYHRLIEDNDVLGQLARTAHAESIIRTRILKEGPEYQFRIEWLHSPKMEIMASDTFTLQENADSGAGGARQVPLSEINKELGKALERMIRKVPYVGMITGRDGESLTVNLGAISGLHKGDELVIGTLEDVKKHPLLKAIVDWRFAETGTAEVESVDERIAFAKVLTEADGRQIGRYQKILRIIPAQAAPKPATAAMAPIDEGEPDHLVPPRSDDRPKLGWVAAGPLLGGYSRQYANASGTGQSGGGLALGARADAQLWFNRQIFIEAGFGYEFWSYSQQALSATGATGASSTSVSASLSTVHADLGYTYLLTGDFFGPKGWIKAGFKSSTYTFPVATAASGIDTGPISFKDLFIGLGGDLPVRGRWGGLLNLDFGLFPSATETGFISGSTSSALDIDFSLGGYYHYTNRLSFRCLIDVQAQSVNFVSGTSLSQKTIAIVPMAVYSF